MVLILRLISVHAFITNPASTVWVNQKVPPDFMTPPSHLDKPVTLRHGAALRTMERHLVSEHSIVRKPISTQITQTHIHIHTAMIDTDKHSIISSLCGFWSSTLWIETDRICSFVSRHKIWYQPVRTEWINSDAVSTEIPVVHLFDTMQLLYKGHVHGCASGFTS